MVNMLLDMYDGHTYDEIAKKISKKFKVKVTSNGARKAHERYRLDILDKQKKSDGPRMLVIDIETSPILARIWSLWSTFTALNQIDVDWHLMSFAAKWYDSDEIIYMDQSKEKDITNDKKMLKVIWKLLDEADIVITQNGKKFDTKKINARFVMNGMQPPSSYRNIDTFLIAKRHFGFTSNKLEYMTDKLCTKYKKLSHGKYPGNKLWEECLKGNMDAWAEMEEYNKYDVLSLQELYDVLVPWDDRINFTVYFEDDRCSCGSTDLRKNGIYYTNANKYQKYKCKDCGKEYRDRKAIKSDKRLRTTNKRG
jgi:hypothetical protein